MIELFLLQVLIIPPPVNEYYLVNVLFGSGIEAKYIELLPQKDDAPDARQSSQLNWMNVTACFQEPGKDHFQYNFKRHIVFLRLTAQTLISQTPPPPHIN